MSLVATELDPLDIMFELVLEDGRLWGEVACDQQIDDAAAIFAKDGPNKHFETRPRGGSKSTDIAGVAVSILRTTMPRRARGYCVAANADQAAEIIDAAGGLIDRTPLLDGVLRVENERIVNDDTDAWIRVLPASESGAWGKRDCHILICDEFCQWPDTRGARRVWTAVRTTIQKTPGCQLVILSSSGEPSHWSYPIFQRALAGLDGWRVSVMPGPVPWQDPAELEALEHELSPSEYRRLILNEWAADEDRGVSEEDWEEAKVPCRFGGTKSRRWSRVAGPANGQRYIVFVDIGLVKDATVIGILHAEPLGTSDRHGPKRVVVDHLERWQGSKRSPVQLQGPGGVEDRVVELAIEYNRARIHADPSQFVGSLQNMNRGGLHAEEWKFTSSSVGELASALVQAFRNRLISVPDDKVLKDELLKVRLVETASGQPRLDHDRSGHDDQAVVIGGGCHILLGGSDSLTAFRQFMDRRATERAEKGTALDPVEVRKRRELDRFSRSISKRHGAGERMRAREQRSCAHRWRQEPPHACAFGCGACRDQQ